MKVILKRGFTDIIVGGELAESLDVGDEIEIISVFNSCYPECCESYITFTHPEINGICEGFIYESNFIKKR